MPDKGLMLLKLFDSDLNQTAINPLEFNSGFVNSVSIIFLNFKVIIDNIK